MLYDTAFCSSFFIDMVNQIHSSLKQDGLMPGLFPIKTVMPGIPCCLWYKCRFKRSRLHCLQLLSSCPTIGLLPWTHRKCIIDHRHYQIDRQLVYIIKGKTGVRTWGMIDRYTHSILDVRENFNITSMPPPPPLIILKGIILLKSLKFHNGYLFVYFLYRFHAK